MEDYSDSQTNSLLDSQEQVLKEISAINEAKLSGKAKRFSPDEKDFLGKLVSKYSDTINGRGTNAVSMKKKKRAWAYVTKEFNSGAVSTTFRTTKQLQLADKNTKTRNKTIIAKQKIENKATGGGPFKAKLSASAAAAVALNPALYEPVGEILDSDANHHGTPLKTNHITTMFQQESMLVQYGNESEGIEKLEQQLTAEDSTVMGGRTLAKLSGKKKTPVETVSRSLYSPPAVWTMENLIEQIVEPDGRSSRIALTNTTASVTTNQSTNTQPAAASTNTQPAARSTNTQPAARSTNTQPAARSTNTQPATASTNTQPVARSTNTQPAARSTNTQPAARSTNTQPAAPSTTTQPAAPSTTTQPAAPSTTTQPAARSTNTQPAARSTNTQPAARPAVTQQDLFNSLLAHKQARLEHSNNSAATKAGLAAELLEEQKKVMAAQCQAYAEVANAAKSLKRASDEIEAVVKRAAEAQAKYYELKLRRLEREEDRN